jgi:hypothetical protein
MPSAKYVDPTAEFQRRRRNWLRIMVPSMILLFGGVAAGIAIPGLPRWVWLTAFCIGFIGSAASNRIANYRCARCDTVPYGGEGTLFNPEVAVSAN